MYYVLLGLVGVALTAGLVDAFSSDDKDEPDDKIDPPGPHPGSYDLLSGEVLETSNGDDIITAGREGDSPVDGATLYAKGGDDLVTLSVQNSEIYGGAGDDTITGSAQYSEIRGGMGNDLIDLDLDHSMVSGGQGDDHLIGRGGYSALHGAGGNDTIDAREMHSGTIYGGDGEDLLILRTSTDPEHWGLHAYGGAGDDTLRVYTQHDSDLFRHTLHGDAGADVFEVHHTPDPEVKTTSEGIPDLNSTLVTVADFEPGVDTLQLHLGRLPDGTAPDVQIVESLNGSGTVVIVSHAATFVQQSGTVVDTIKESRIWMPQALGVTAADVEILYAPAGDAGSAVSA